MARDDGITGAVLMAFVPGPLSGAAVALLTAPSAGEETRQRLNERAREGRERATDAARQGREFVNRQRDTLTSAIDRGREAYQGTRSTEEDMDAASEAPE